METSQMDRLDKIQQLCSEKHQIKNSLQNQSLKTIIIWLSFLSVEIRVIRIRQRLLLPFGRLNPPN